MIELSGQRVAIRLSRAIRKQADKPDIPSLQPILGDYPREVYSDRSNPPVITGLSDYPAIRPIGGYILRKAPLGAFPHSQIPTKKSEDYGKR